MTKQISTLLTIISLFIFTSASCQDKTGQANVVANNFLSSYFENEFAKASSFCNEEIGAILATAAAEYEKLNEKTKALIKETVDKISFNITETVKKDKNQVVISYEINVPESESPVKAHLTLSYIDKKWIVVKFNEL